MSLQPHSIEHLDRLSKYYWPKMLVLGATGSDVPAYATARDYFARWVGDDYEELDLDGGDLRLDLNADVGLTQSHRTVFNIGTIEHVWNAHNAWANALRTVEIGGHFLTHGPINGWVNHGLHATNPAAIRAFVSKNGFEILDEWSSRWKQQGETMWMAAVKRRHIDDLAAFEPAWQVYEAGQKKAVR